MVPVEHLEDIEQLYAQVLDLTQEQEQCLRSGDLTPLPQILEQKFNALSQAQALTTLLLGTTTDRESAAFQEALNRVGAILAQMVSAEDRCKSLVPTPPKPQARQQAATAYGKIGRGR